MRTNGLVFGALLITAAAAHGQSAGCANGGCGPSGCYGPSAQCSPCNSGWQFDFGNRSGSRAGGRCASGRCGTGYECGPECQALKRFLGWAFYRPLCLKSSCAYKNCCHPPLYALFPCPPHVACPCDAGHYAPPHAGPVVGAPATAAPATATPPKAEPAKTPEVPSVPSVPTTPSTAVPANAGPVVQTAMFNKAAGTTSAQPVTAALPVATAQPTSQGKRLSTYDPSKIAPTMPALDPSQFRKPIKPGEGCPK